MNMKFFGAVRYMVGVLCAFIALTYCFSRPSAAVSSSIGLSGAFKSENHKTLLDANKNSATESDPMEILALEGLRGLSPFFMAGPSVSATKSHSPAGPFHLGDTITYTINISDTVADATGVEFTDTPDANTTLAGSIMASPVAVNDGPYVCTGNLSIAVPVGSGLLANDYLGLNPTATITAFDAASANGGTV
ncbi:MAG: hypothetical protein ACREAC_29315, partial [Blastocatellia bacterium]